MNTKEEILIHSNFDLSIITFSEEKALLKAMDEWAKIVAIDFAKWIQFEGFLDTGKANSTWYQVFNKNKEYTSKRLFQLYLNSIK